MNKKSARIRRATRARKKIAELAAHRLVINRTPRHIYACLLYTSPSPRDLSTSRMPSSA